QAALGPLDFIGRAASDGGVTAPAEHVNDLLVEVALLLQRLAGGYLIDHGIHVNVARKIQVQAAAACVGPGLHFLLGRVEQRIPVDHGDLASLDPLAVVITFNTAPAADVGR